VQIMLDDDIWTELVVILFCKEIMVHHKGDFNEPGEY
jgi:hypothetical protein